MKTDYDFIVLGCGGIGSAAIYWLSLSAGKEVLGLEQYKLGHDNGASQDHSRIIRLSYHAPEYTALTPHAYTSWSQVEAESGIQLVLKTGGLDIEPAGLEGMSTIEMRAHSMRLNSIQYEELSAQEVMKRWPQFCLEGNEKALYQAESGIVDARKANATHIALARGHCATILDGIPVRDIRPVGDSVQVVTDANTFNAHRLVVAAGAWTNRVLKNVGIAWPLTVTQEQVTYYATPNLRDFVPSRFPIWIWHGSDSFYGFPVYGEVATKVGQDLGGDVVTVDTRTFEPNPRAFERAHRFLEHYLPGCLGPVLYTKTCLYTMPPDRNFVIDTLPQLPQVAIAVGAGHAFKFASLIGRILSELAIDGKTHYPIEAFKIDRPALADPTFPQSFRICT